LPGGESGGRDAGTRGRLRGSVGSRGVSAGTLTIYDHLPAAELEPIIRNCSVVISRSGYSTIMDLMRLGKKAIFIPTPGQTEQEYLGEYLAEKGLVICVRQSQFILKEALACARKLPDIPMQVCSSIDDELLRREVNAALALAPI
jgi:UDP-N-acetylglucosamine transferase subunit ALG13